MTVLESLRSIRKACVMLGEFLLTLLSTACDRVGKLVQSAASLSNARMVV